MRKNLLKILCLHLLILSFVGCAFGTRNVTLSALPDKANNATLATGEKGVIVLKQFLDQRTDKELIGHVQNGFGQKTAKVKAKNDVSKWVMETIASKLTQNGYKVIFPSENSESSTNLILSGQILNIYCTAGVSYEGEVTFRAKLENNTKKIFEKTYIGTQGSGLNWAATSGSFGKTVSLSLQDALNHLIVDINSETQKNKNKGEVSR